MTFDEFKEICTALVSAKSGRISRPPFSRKMDWQRQRRDWSYRSLNLTSLDFLLEVYFMYTLSCFAPVPHLLKELKFSTRCACVLDYMQILFTVWSENVYCFFVRSPQSAVRNPQSAVHIPQSTVRNPQSGVRSSKSAIRSPKSETRSPQSEIRNPQYTVPYWHTC
jgi:hypothetical protein